MNIIHASGCSSINRKGVFEEPRRQGKTTNNEELQNSNGKSYDKNL